MNVSQRGNKNNVTWLSMGAQEQRELNQGFLMRLGVCDFLKVTFSPGG
jgi:hypothetical protein